jgi:hypothetical protein
LGKLSEVRDSLGCLPESNFGPTDASDQVFAATSAGKGGPAASPAASGLWAAAM